MIYRRYGSKYQSVDVVFDANALNEFGFRRNHSRAVDVDALESDFVLIRTVELSTQAEGAVQTETEHLMLERLREQIDKLVTDLPEGGALIVENESGHDYPKPRQVTKNVIENGENRLFFEYTMSPPLRVTLYRPA